MPPLPFPKALFGAGAVAMKSTSFPEWEVDIKVPSELLPVAYSYVVVDQASGQVVDKEAGSAR